LIWAHIFYYRRRNDSSAVQNYKQNKEFYFDTLNYVLYNLINKSIKVYNNIPPFIQFLIVYDVVFRIKQNALQFMDINSNFRIYCNIIEDIYNKIDDKYILEQKTVSNRDKLLHYQKIS
jgi:hypothetical protein